MSYENVLRTLKETKTVSAHITALGKLRTQTEDQVLLNKLDKAIASLQTAHATAKRAKSTPTHLDRATDPAVKDLVDHCTKAVGSKKPEWQVIAERNGWGPKE